MYKLTPVLFALLLVPALTLAATPGTFTVGSLYVSRHGNHGRPLILIPGTGSGAWVWKDTIDHFQSDHVIYAVTLAGFDGTPPPAAGNYTDQAVASLRKLIDSMHITKPVLIGHSLGGALAIRFAEEHADLLAGVISVDAPPVFPGTEDFTLAQRQKMAQELRAEFAAMTPAQFAAQQVEEMQQSAGVLDPMLAKQLGALQASSDPGAVGEYIAEGVSTDLRPGLGKITVPLLEISPYNPADFHSGPGKMPESRKADLYQTLLKGAPDAHVVSISPARHFVMYDQPAKFHATLAKFLATLPRH